MKIRNLNEWTDKQQSDILNSMNDIEAQEDKRDEKNKSSGDIQNSIKEKLKKKSYSNREELTQDVVALFKKWQQKL